MYTQAPQPRRRNPLPFIVAGLVAVLLIVGLRFVFLNDSEPGDQKAQETAEPKCGGDGLTLNLSSSTEKDDLLAQIAKEYSGREVGGKCVDVVVTGTASGTAMRGLAGTWDERVGGPEPDIWSPAASAWITLLRKQLAGTERAGSVPAETPSIAQTPVVIAMPEQMAKALGWPKKKLGWADLLQVSGSGWATFGHPEWGDFRWGKTNPNVSTTGLNATIAAYFAATGRTSDLSEKDVADPKVRNFVQSVEQSVVHYGDTTLTFLCNLRRADDEGRALSYVSAIVVEEKSVWDYNQGRPLGDCQKSGKPAQSLVAIYPKEGTLFSDNPYAVMTTDPAKQKAAADFLKHLHSKEIQQRFTEEAFRDKDGKAGNQISQANGLLPNEPATKLSPPIPDVLDQVLQSWSELRKPANVLLVIDTSGSMAEDVPGTGQNRLELAKRAAVNALPQFGGHDSVGLWMFSSKLEGDTDHRELVPIGKLSEQIGGKPRLDAIRERIEGLPPEGGTGLYDTVLNSYQQVSAKTDPNAINAVVFLTDGKNEDEGISLDNLLRELETESGGVRVFTIGYGSDADLGTLQKIADATDARAYDASKADSIDQIFTDVISNF